MFALLSLHSIAFATEYVPVGSFRQKFFRAFFRLQNFARLRLRLQRQQQLALEHFCKTVLDWDFAELTRVFDALQTLAAYALLGWTLYSVH